MSAAKSPPAPFNPEKLALRGEPTARTILQDFVNAHLNYAKLDQARDAASAYLSTRAQQEETLLREGYAYAATDGREGLYAVRDAALALPVEGRAPGLVVCDFGGGWSTPHERNVNCINPRRAPDASHEKKLGKKGGG